MIGSKIADIAVSFDGQEEIQPNKGFKDPAYAARIIATGWQVGELWCAIIAGAENSD